VNVSVENEASKEIGNIQIEYENLASSYTLNAASDSDKYATVVVKGVQSVIDSITAENIKAYVDLNGYSVGTHEVNVLVEGTDVRATYTPKVKTINIIIKSKS
jgi:YbbR domain-containing protein